MKLFHVIATSVLGTAMALGTGFALANKQNVRQAKADMVEFTLLSASSVTKDGVTISFDKGTGSSAPAWYAAGLRLYAKNTITVESSSLSVTGVSFDWEKQGSKAFATATASVGTYSHPSDTGKGTWSGDSSSVTFTLGDAGQLQLNTLSVATGGTVEPSITIDKDALNFETGGSAQVVTVTPADFSGTPTLSVSGVPACVSATPSGLTVSVSPLAAGAGKFTITATYNTEVATADVNVSVKEPFALPTDGTYYLKATRDSTTYYLKSNGGSSAPSAVTNKDQATAFNIVSTGETGEYTIKTSDGKYLFTTDTNNGVRVGDTSDAWVFSEGTLSTGMYDIKSTASNRYLTLYNSSDWRCYSTPDIANREENTDLEVATEKTLQSITLSKNDSQVKKAYFVGDSASTAGLTVMATYDSGDPVDVTTSAVITPNPATVQLSTTSISYTATFGGKTSNSVTVTGITVSKANGIASIYSMSANDAVDVYGYYVGFLDGTGPVIMNGEYGVVIFAKTHDVSGYTEKETILHVTGSVSIYKGLYEIAGTVSITKVDSAVGDLDAPIVYASRGGETADYASRLTTVTGYVASVTSGSLTADPRAADIKMNFQVGSSTIEVFYKKAAQTSKDMATLKDSLDNSTELTVKGFTSWYNGFQVQMSGVVEAVVGYTAEDFAQDLMVQTDAVCAGYVEGDNNHDAIVAIWSDLASADKYPSLPADQKAILAAADADEHSSDVVEQAMARYDFLTVRYNLNNFINGRLGGSETNTINTISHSNDLAAIIVTISVVALVSSVGFFLVIRKRKHQ